MSVRRRCVLVVLCACVAACGSDGTVPSDATAADGGDATPFEVDIAWLADGVPPIAPLELTPCPDGWRAETADGTATCDPYPEGGALDCPPGQAHFPGEPGCVPVGAPCPSGDFPDDLPVDRTVVHVRQGATGGDGSRARPYGTLTEFALGGLPSRSIVALSRGTYLGPFSLRRGLALFGACSAETLLVADVPDDRDGVVNMIADRGELRSVTIGASPRAGVRLFDTGAEAELDGVIVESAQGVGLGTVLGARLVGRSIVIRGTTSGSAPSRNGQAIAADDGTAVELTRAVIEQNTTVASVTVRPMASLTLSDAVVRRSLPEPAGAGGRGVYALEASLDLERVLIEECRTFGVEAVRATVAMRDVLVRDTRAADIGGRGMEAQGSTVELGSTLIERNEDVGLFLIGGMTTASDVVIRDTRSRPSDGRSGRGLELASGAAAEVSRAVITRNREAGIFAGMADVSLALSDAVVRDSEARSGDGLGGRGLDVEHGPRIEIHRALFERNRSVGLFVHGTGSSLIASDVVVRGTTSDAMGFGRAVNMQRQATGELSRVVLEHNRDLSVFAASTARVSISDAVLHDTMERACAATSCSESPGGIGIGSYDAGTSLRLERFLLRRSALCGVQLARDGEIDLVSGEVSEHPIGVCIQVEGYDIDRLTTDVRYVNNGINLEATSLPIPDTSTP